MDFQCELTKSIETSETTKIVWEFSNYPNHQESGKNDIRELIQILETLEHQNASEDGFTLRVKCSIQDKKQKFISSSLMLSWEQFDLTYEIDDIQKDYLVPLEFAQ